MKIESTNPDKSRSISNSSGVSLFSVLEKPGLTAEYAVSLPTGFHLEDAQDGGLRVIGPSAANEPKVIVARIEAPYAVDKSGKLVSTSYKVHGNMVIQSVTDSHAQYPVVADPKIQYGWGVYIGALGKEWDALGRFIVSGGIIAGTSACYIGKAPTPWVGALQTVCKAAGIGALQKTFNALKATWSQKPTFELESCYQIRVPSDGPGLKKVSRDKCV